MKNKYTLGEKCADIIAKFGGSWSFIAVYTAIMGAWIGYNLVAVSFDPYPFILLNLFLSMTAAMQAPIILMAANRQSQIDRKRDDKDFELDKDTNKKIDKILEILSEGKNS